MLCSTDNERNARAATLHHSKQTLHRKLTHDTTTYTYIVGYCSHSAFLLIKLQVLSNTAVIWFATVHHLTM